MDLVLDKVRAHKTVASKRKNLERALAGLRAADVPNELQRKQIERLEKALVALGDASPAPSPEKLPRL